MIARSLARPNPTFSRAQRRILVLVGFLNGEQCRGASTPLPNDRTTIFVLGLDAKVGTLRVIFVVVDVDKLVVSLKVDLRIIAVK